MNSLTSKIFTLSAPRQLFLKEEVISLDELAGDEMICETLYSAISPGTETAAYAGLPPLRPGNIYPRVVGYCNVAKVVQCGVGVSEWKVGEYMLSFQSHRTFFKARQSDFAIKLKQGTDLRKAVTAYLFHLGYHALISADARAGHNIGIVGIGTLGLSTAIMCKTIGAATFAFTNQEPPRVLINENIKLFKKDVPPLNEIALLTHQTGIDIVINTSNSWTDWKLSLELVRKGGTIVNIGFPGRGEPLPDFNPLDPIYTYFKSIQIKGLCYINETDSTVLDSRFNMKRNLEYLLDKITDGSIDAGSIITGEIHYSKLGDQYEKYASRQQQLFSTLISWED